MAGSCSLLIEYKEIFRKRLGNSTKYLIPDSRSQHKESNLGHLSTEPRRSAVWSTLTRHHISLPSACYVSTGTTF
jgi:hypothetical protein